VFPTDHQPCLPITPHLTSPRPTRANKITSRSCSSTSYTKSQARVRFRVRLPALGRIQSQSRAFPFRPPARNFLATGELADWLQQSIAWRGLPDNFQRLAHRKSRCRLLLSCLTSSPPSTSLSFALNFQTSAHRRLSAAVHSTQKNLKTRKTRPFIDSLVEGSRTSTPYALTTALTAHARVSIARISQSLATD
jgi:hypothetical protein